MKASILIFLKLIIHAWCDDMIPYGTSLGGSTLTVYPCNDSKDIVIQFNPSRPLRERNQYYLYVNIAFPMNAVIQTRFNSDVNMTAYPKKINYMPGFMSYQYKIKGTRPGKVPYLSSFTVNGVEYCNQPYVGFLDYLFTNIDSETPRNCGRRKILHTELIVSGVQTKPGDWPWHAAIYRLDNLVTKYICGGSLVSKNFVLTAAHCTQLRGVQVSPEALNVVLGKYYLIGSDIGSENREVLKIIVHENFQRRYLHNDIALLKLKTEVRFTDYIQPACLWYNNADEKLLSLDIMGTIVGWGIDSNETLSHTMKRAQLPMIENYACIESDPQFYAFILNENKFCAGFRNGTAACNGDSGGAFQVFIPDSVLNGKASNSGTWLIRGIVSLAMSQNNAPICDPEQYVVFTDIAKYLPWIENHLYEGSGRFHDQRVVMKQS